MRQTQRRKKPSARHGATLASRVQANRPASVGAALVAAVLAAVIVGPLVWTSSAVEQNLAEAFASISLEHPLGTDQYGRDLLARVLIGGRASFIIGLGSVAIALIPGVLLGTLAASRTGLIRALIMRVTDALLAVPQTVLAVILVAALGFGLMPLIAALAVATVPIFIRVSYAASLNILSRDYVLAARVTGSTEMRTIIGHVIPNSSSAILSIASLRAAINVIIGAGLNFFGLGVQPPRPEWGLMIAETQGYVFNHPYLLFPPGILLACVAVGLNLVGDGVRDWFDPRLRTT